MTTMTTTPLDLTDECYRCGYALQGIADEHACPECGLLAERSRRPSEELFDTHPRWLRRLSRGVWLLLGAIVAAVAAPMVMQALYWWVTGWRFTFTAYRHVEPVGFDVAALLLLWGVWLLTSREGYPPADQADRKFRRLLWWAALPPALAMLIFHAATELSANGIFGAALRTPVGNVSLYDFASYLAGVGSIPLPLLLFRRLRDLALRARSAHLAEHCTIVGIGASGAVAFAVACMFVSDHAEDWLGTYWTSRSQVWITITALMATAALLFVIWSVYLLIRFAVRFGRASGELKRRWMMQDRSVVI